MNPPLSQPIYESSDIEMLDVNHPLSASNAPTLPTMLTQSGRPTRGIRAQNYRRPRRWEDIPPESPTPIPPPTLPFPEANTPIIRRVILHVRDILRTAANRFGVFREYPYRPSHDPDAFVSTTDLSICPTPSSPGQSRSQGDGISVSSVRGMEEPPWPFANMSIYRLIEWATTGSNQKSQSELNRLAKEVISAPDFKAEDFKTFSAQREYRRFDASDAQGSSELFSGDGWHESDVQINIPTGKKDPTGLGYTFSIPELHHRSLLGVIKAGLANVTSRHFHFSPFKRFRRTSAGVEERCYDEVYTSDAFLDANRKLQDAPNEPDCKLEKVVLGLMFWSDSTHLANFGTAKVWPLYLYFANLSKYFRGKPGSGASHHVAYIPSVSI
jgi:hypothetical protein